MRASDKANDTIKNINAFDRQIATADHDTIMMWLYEKFKDEDFVLNLLRPESDGLPYSVSGVERSIERPLYKDLYSSSNPIIGFADLSVTVRLRRDLTLEQKTDHLKRKEWLALPPYERRGKDEPKDCYHETARDYSLFIEVKTSVNIGETIRQINYYRGKAHYSPNNQWYVCSPDFPGSEVLKEQGIGFIEYQP